MPLSLRRTTQNRAVKRSIESNGSARLFWLLGIFWLIAIFLGWRLWRIAVVSQESFLDVARAQQTGEVILPANRGEIALVDDPAGQTKFAVAKNLDTYSVSLVPRNIDDIDRVADVLERLTPQPAAETKRAYENAKDKFYLPPLKHGLSPEQRTMVEAEKLSGVIFQLEPKRVYPENQLAAQVIGFLNAEAKGYGIEATYQDILSGKPGFQYGTKGAAGGGFISDAGDVPPENGQNILLTLDRNIQYVVEEKLKAAVEKFQAEGGEVVVVDPSTGAILAMAQYPSFDPNQYSKVPSSQESVYRNAAISFPWEPGSIMKPLVQAAALESGAVGKDFSGDFTASVTVQGHEIHTATNKAFGHETLSQILENSDNVAMVKVAEIVGSDKLRDILEKFGFNQKTGIDVKGEIAGQLPGGKHWSDISRATVSFGQGLTTTPLQIVMGYAAIGNGGMLKTPFLVRSKTTGDGETVATKPAEGTRIMSQDTAETIAGYLRNVVVLGHGKRANVAGYLVAGKTGTAQIPSPSGGYNPNDHIGSFAGFAPLKNPRFAMIVKLNKPKSVEFAESSAAPTFSEIASFILSYYRVSPDA